MPYSGPDDPSLPSNVKKLPSQKRKQWAAIFNSTIKNCQGSDCEGKAFRIANGVAAKELLMSTPIQCSNCQKWEILEEGQKEIDCSCGQKCMPEYASGGVVPVQIEEAYKPLGGAQSFEEYDAYAAAQEKENQIGDLKATFNFIFRNIMDDETLDLTAKASAVEAASRDLSERVVQSPQAIEEAQQEAALAAASSKEGGVMDTVIDRVKSFLGQKQETKSENGKNFQRGDYAYTPNGPSTWKLRLTNTPGGAPDAGIVGAAAAALGKGFRGNKVQIPAGDLAAVKGRVRAAWRKANPDKKPDEMPTALKELEKSHFYVTKDLAGNLRWLAINSNKFYDRENQVFPEKVHLDYIEQVDRTKEYPELWVWHVPGSKIGQADFAAYTDGFVIHSGTFDSDAKEAAEYLASHRDLGVSHGFAYPKDALDKDGVYHNYKTIEISPLPGERAANLWTGFSVQEEYMAFTKEKKDFLVSVLGEKRASTIEQSVSSLNKELEEAGIGWKDLADALVPGENGNGEPKEEEEPIPVSSPEGEEPVQEEAAPSSAPESSPAEEAPVSAAVEKALKSFSDSIEQKFSVLEKEITELKKSDDEKIAEKMAPKAAATRPSQSNGNLLDGEAAKEITDAQGDSSAPVNPATGYVEDLIGGHVIRGQ